MNTPQKPQLHKHSVSHSLSGNDQWLCKDCGKDCFIDDKDYYMVKDEIWDKKGVGTDMLCMDCMEERIGHKLTKNDILPCPLTEITNSYTKNILNCG